MYNQVAWITLFDTARDVQTPESALMVKQTFNRLFKLQMERIHMSMSAEAAKVLFQKLVEAINVPGEEILHQEQSDFRQSVYEIIMSEDDNPPFMARIWRLFASLNEPDKSTTTTTDDDLTDDDRRGNTDTDTDTDHQYDEVPDE